MGKLIRARLLTSYSIGNRESLSEFSLENLKAIEKSGKIPSDLVQSINTKLKTSLISKEIYEAIRSELGLMDSIGIRERLKKKIESKALEKVLIAQGLDNILVKLVIDGSPIPKSEAEILNLSSDDPTLAIELPSEQKLKSLQSEVVVSLRRALERELRENHSGKDLKIEKTENGYQIVKRGEKEFSPSLQSYNFPNQKFSQVKEVLKLGEKQTCFFS